MYRLLASRLKNLLAYYVFGESDGEGGVTPHPEKVFYGPYPAPELYRAELPAACVTVAAGTSEGERQPHSRENVPETTPQKMTVREMALYVEVRYQIDVVAKKWTDIWGDGENEGLCDKLMRVCAENKWLADDAGEQLLRLELVGQAQTMDRLEDTRRWRRAMLEVVLSGHLLTSREETRATEVQVEVGT